jgi:hypothetical protein
MYNEYYNNEQQNNYKMFQQQKKKKTPIIIVIIIAILLLLCCCCVGCPMAIVGNFQNTFTEVFGETVEMEIDYSDVSDEWVTNTEYTNMVTVFFDFLGLKNAIVFEDGYEEDMIVCFASEDAIEIDDLKNEIDDFEYVYTNNGEWLEFKQYDDSNNEYTYIYMSIGEDSDLTYVFMYYPQSTPDFDSLYTVLEIVEEDCFVEN